MVRWEAFSGKLWGKPAITLHRGKDRELQLQGYEGAIWKVGDSCSEFYALLTPVAIRRLGEPCILHRKEEQVVRRQLSDLPRYLEAIGYTSRRPKQAELANNWSYRFGKTASGQAL